MNRMTLPIGSAPDGRVSHALSRYLCRPAGAAAEPVTIPETISPFTGAFLCLNQVSAASHPQTHALR